MPGLCTSISLQIISGSHLPVSPTLTLRVIEQQKHDIYFSLPILPHQLILIFFPFCDNLLDLFIAILIFIFVLCDICLFSISEPSFHSCYFLYHLTLFLLNYLGRYSIMLLLYVIFVSVLPVLFIFLYILNI
jgi:hypothetical protein